MSASGNGAAWLASARPLGGTLKSVPQGDHAQGGGSVTDATDNCLRFGFVHENFMKNLGELQPFRNRYVW